MICNNCTIKSIEREKIKTENVYHNHPTFCGSKNFKVTIDIFAFKKLFLLKMVTRLKEELTGKHSQPLLTCTTISSFIFNPSFIKNIYISLIYEISSLNISMWVSIGSYKLICNLYNWTKTRRTGPCF